MCLTNCLNEKKRKKLFRLFVAHVDAFVRFQLLLFFFLAVLQNSVDYVCKYIVVVFFCCTSSYDLNISARPANIKHLTIERCRVPRSRIICTFLDNRGRRRPGFNKNIPFASNNYRLGFVISRVRHGGKACRLRYC